MEKKNDTAKIFGIMAGLAMVDGTGITATAVIALAIVVIIRRELDP